MIRLTLMDESHLEIPREEAVELLPYRRVFRSKLFKSPVEALVAHRGKLVPVLGPLPDPGEESASVDQRPWLLLMKGCAQVIRGLPQFEEAASNNVIPLPGSKNEEDDNTLLEELDELLKGA